MIRLIQLALLLAIIIPFGMARAQEDVGKALFSIRQRFEKCAGDHFKARTPQDGWVGFSEVEQAFRDCESEERYLLTAIEAMAPNDATRRQAIAMHYKSRVDLKNRLIDQHYEKMIKALPK